ncbi:hypothetical protein POM88_018984 [Heracleum sosnowskyi]|uniref:Uncharacterized protein n=1 Tax=Heracleum sosnowskyi TaxID=360622 RepID=A0AAD8ITZ7_9APIA|nr:hypothetical protein POM88_018984 [Heracleum sosnowskyi]
MSVGNGNMHKLKFYSTLNLNIMGSSVHNAGFGSSSKAKNDEDALTSQLEILPFAKLCVDHKIRDAFPDKINAIAIDAPGKKSTVEMLETPETIVADDKVDDSTNVMKDTEERRLIFRCEGRHIG